MELKKIIKIIVFLTCIFVSMSLIFLDWNSNNYDTKLQIKNIESGKVNNFLVKIAKTDTEKEHGLMWTKSLAQNHGMMFEFENERIILMWMKNTKISLDMIFINKKNMVIRIENNAKAESFDIISSNFLALKVLEIKGGMAKKLNIQIGDLIVY